MESVRCLLEWGKSRHRYLFRGYQTIPTSQREQSFIYGVVLVSTTGPVHFRTYDELGVESTIHFRAKLAAIISERGLFIYTNIGDYLSITLTLFPLTSFSCSPL